MSEFRSVPESRIKTLEVHAVYDLAISIPHNVFREQAMIEQAGREIAFKLMQFNKVKVTEKDSQMIYHFRIDVIVPEGPPT